MLDYLCYLKYIISLHELTIKLHSIKIKRKTKMISNPDWHKPKIKPYLHQISLGCIEKLVDCQEKFNKGEIDADTSFKIDKQILTDEIQGNLDIEIRELF